MEFVIDGKQLRLALKDIKKAEKRGFMYCQAIFEFVQAGKMLDQNVAEYGELMEKAHPTNGNLDWGRGQDITKNCKFIKGRLVEEK